MGDLLCQHHPWTISRWPSLWKCYFTGLKLFSDAHFKPEARISTSTRVPREIEFVVGVKQQRTERLASICTRRLSPRHHFQLFRATSSVLRNLLQLPMQRMIKKKPARFSKIVKQSWCCGQDHMEE